MWTILIFIICPYLNHSVLKPLSKTQWGHWRASVRTFVALRSSLLRFEDTVVSSNLDSNVGVANTWERRRKESIEKKEKKKKSWRIVNKWTKTRQKHTRVVKRKILRRLFWLFQFVVRQRCCALKSSVHLQRFQFRFDPSVRHRIAKCFRALFIRNNQHKRRPGTRKSTERRHTFVLASSGFGIKTILRHRQTTSDQEFKDCRLSWVPRSHSSSRRIRVLSRAPGVMLPSLWLKNVP